jgi:hypothetical protein
MMPGRFKEFTKPFGTLVEAHARSCIMLVYFAQPTNFRISGPSECEGLLCVM